MDNITLQTYYLNIEIMEPRKVFRFSLILFTLATMAILLSIMTHTNLWPSLIISLLSVIAIIGIAGCIRQHVRS